MHDPANWIVYDIPKKVQRAAKITVTFDRLPLPSEDNIETLSINLQRTKKAAGTRDSGPDQKRWKRGEVRRLQDGRHT
jgi:hypothetical protein